jgi:hypothetical protein
VLSFFCVSVSQKVVENLRKNWNFYAKQIFDKIDFGISTQKKPPYILEISPNVYINNSTYMIQFSNYFDFELFIVIFPFCQNVENLENLIKDT